MKEKMRTNLRNMRIVIALLLAVTLIPLTAFGQTVLAETTSLEFDVSDDQVLSTSVVVAVMQPCTVEVTIDDESYIETAQGEQEVIVNYPEQLPGTPVFIKVISPEGEESEVREYEVYTPFLELDMNSEDITTTSISGTLITDNDKEDGNKLAKVTAQIGSKKYTATIKNQKFKITYAKQKLGTKIKVIAVTNNGLTTDKTVTLKNIPVKLSVNSISVRTSYIKGNTEKGAAISIKIGSKTYKTKAANSGAFSVKIPAQKKNTSIKVKTVSSKGYYNEKTYKVKSVKTNVYINDYITMSTTKVSGKIVGAVKGDYIVATIGSRKYKGTISSSQKSYSITIPKQPYNAKVKVQLVAGNGTPLSSLTEKVYTSKYVKIGMTKSQVLKTTWGKPDEIYRYTYSYGTVEQWVYYYSTYNYQTLYFLNGKIYYIQG